MARSGKTAASVSGEPGASLPRPVALMTSAPGFRRDKHRVVVLRHAARARTRRGCRGRGSRGSRRGDRAAAGLRFDTTMREGRSAPRAALRQVPGERDGRAARAHGEDLGPRAGEMTLGHEAVEREARGDRVLRVADELARSASTGSSSPPSGAAWGSISSNMSRRRRRGRACASSPARPATADRTSGRPPPRGSARAGRGGRSRCRASRRRRGRDARAHSGKTRMIEDWAVVTPMN